MNETLDIKEGTFEGTVKVRDNNFVVLETKDGEVKGSVSRYRYVPELVDIKHGDTVKVMLDFKGYIVRAKLIKSLEF